MPDLQPLLACCERCVTAGKGIIGMKILGQGDMRSRPDDALRYALSLNLLDAFTIGAENKAEQNDLIRPYRGCRDGHARRKLAKTDMLVSGLAEARAAPRWKRELICGCTRYQMIRTLMANLIRRYPPRKNPK